MITLADLTPEKRTKCSGMWCETAISKALVIYVADDQDNKERAVVVNPRSQFRTVIPLHALAPRPDLPRAWTPDGTPPAGEWEYAEIPGLGESTQRWVGEWEYK